VQKVEVRLPQRSDKDSCQASDIDEHENAGLSLINPEDITNEFSPQVHRDTAHQRDKSIYESLI
jgi:hypothetical protein